MIKTHIETKEYEAVDDVICNKCGKSCKTNCGNFEGIIEYTFMGGYDSYLGDQRVFTFSMCEHCIEKMFETFMHSPERTDEEDV